MVTRILHVSDLHTGARDDPVVAQALAGMVDSARPELILASGDLTHRGRRDQHERAAALLRSLGVPVLAVPGNHDIPYSFPARFSHPWREFDREWETTEPVYASPSLHAVGLNSVRPWRHQSGGLTEEQLDRAAARLAEAAPGALRVVALHHQLVNAPWRSRKKPVARRDHVLARLASAGAELIVGGHVHQVAVAERREFAVLDGPAAPVVISIAPGIGQPRPHRLGEARGCAVYVADDDALTVETSIWVDGGWTRTASRRFARG